MTITKRRGRPPKANQIVLKVAAKKENLSPWLNEVSDLNQEINALRRQLSATKAIVKYLEFQLGLNHYEDSAI